jgi:hypothetical protein
MPLISYVSTHFILNFHFYFIFSLYSFFIHTPPPLNIYLYPKWQWLSREASAYLEMFPGEGVQRVVRLPGGEEGGHLDLKVVAQQQQRSHAARLRLTI